ncbi:MAG: glycosyltransferase family 9 protein [Opitutaceae bacterium]|nr:glycosyltransferase family 9 protein [Opitutaceae bacterium]
MRILVLKGGAIGDFLVTLPALGLLRSKWPDARIELVGNARAAALGVGGGYLDAVHSQHEARWSALFGATPLPAALSAWLAEFDLVLNYWPDPDGLLGRRFPVRAGQQYLSAPATPTLAPAARHFCEPLRALGLSTTDYRARLALPKSAAGLPASRFGLASRQRPLAIHPGSGSPRKNWPAARWLELIGRLETPVLLVLGEAETESWSAPSLGRLLPPSVEVSRNLPLLDLAARLAQCRLFLGHDSGLSHLAAAVGTPCVLLFGPTDPAMWAPPGGHVRVVRRGDTLDAITMEDAAAASAAAIAAMR